MRAFLRRKTTGFPWWLNIRTEQRMFAQFAPALWEALAGLADELGIAMERPAYWFGGGGTLHIIVGEPAKKRVLIGIGGDAAALEEDMLDVNFDRWLAGEDLPISRLQGQLGGMAKPFEWPPRRGKNQTRESRPT